MLHNRRRLAKFAFTGVSVVDGHIIPLAWAQINLWPVSINSVAKSGKNREKAMRRKIRERAYLSRAPDFDTALLQHHLAPVCEPADDARNDEKHGEEVKGEAWNALKLSFDYRAK